MNLHALRFDTLDVCLYNFISWCLQASSLPSQVMLLLSSKKAVDTPITVLHTAALLLSEAGDQMEKGEFNFHFLDGRANLESESGYDTDELGDLLE